MLCIYINKSNVLLVHTQRNKDLADMSINLNETKMEQVSTVKYLGIGPTILLK